MKRSYLKVAFALACCLGFLLIAAYFNSFGVESPALTEYFGITESQTGMVVTAQSIAGIVLTVVLALYGETLNKIYGMAAGLGIMSAGAILIALIPAFQSRNGGYPWLILFAVIGGIGNTTVDVLVKSIVSDVFPQKKESIFPILEAFYSIGAVVITAAASGLVNLEIPSTYVKVYFLIGGAGICLFLIYLPIARKIVPDSPYADMTEIRKRTVENPAEIFRYARAWVILLGSVLLVAFQDSVSMWLAKYCQETLHLEYVHAARMVTVFFAGNLLFRPVCPVLYRKFSARISYVVLALATVGIYLTFILLDWSLTMRYILMALTGIVFSGCTPGAILICCESFPERSASASSTFVLGVSVANIIMPVVIGKTAEKFGFTLPMVAIGVCLGLSAVVFGMAGEKEPAGPLPSGTGE